MIRAIHIVTSFLILKPPALPAQEHQFDYKQLRTGCGKIPPNRELRGRLPDKKVLPLRSFAEFDQALEEFLKKERSGPLSQVKTWVGRPPDSRVFFDVTRSWYADASVPFQPFAQKLVLPSD